MELSLIFPYICIMYTDQLQPSSPSFSTSVVISQSGQIFLASTYEREYAILCFSVSG
jgi:hypothetical protein